MTPAHWLSSGSGNDAGFEDLQTDVMRFMAILAFCLMAVFALVQSLPLTPESPPAPAADPIAPAVSPRATPAAIEPTRAAGAVAKAVPAATITETSSADTSPADISPAETTGVVTPARPTPAPARTVARPEPVPAPMAAAPVEAAAPALPEPAAEPDAAATPSQGVSLRFSSDAALRRLVARGKVGLFAFSEGQSWQLAPSLVDASFRAAKAPTQFHAMATATVPAEVVAALTQHTGAVGHAVSWGVTLPLPTRYAIARLVREFDSGALVIGADGRVTRETPQ